MQAVFTVMEYVLPPPKLHFPTKDAFSLIYPSLPHIFGVGFRLSIIYEPQGPHNILAKCEITCLQVPSEFPKCYNAPTIVGGMVLSLYCNSFFYILLDFFFQSQVSLSMHWQHHTQPE